MPIPSATLWSALESIGAVDGEAGEIAPPVIAKLIELEFVELTVNGLPQLNHKGVGALFVRLSGDGNLPMFNDYPPADS